MQFKHIILIAFFASFVLESKNIFPKQEERADVTIEYFFQDSVVKIKTEMKDWEKNIPCNMVKPMREHIYYITDECDSLKIDSLKLKK
jgi:hypothetical protein